MKLRDVFSPKQFKQRDLPMKTVQRNQNQRHQKSHKTLGKVAKIYKQIGRVPGDITRREYMPIPPRGMKVAK